MMGCLSRNSVRTWVALPRSLMGVVMGVVMGVLTGVLTGVLQALSPGAPRRWYRVAAGASAPGLATRTGLRQDRPDSVERKV